MARHHSTGVSMIIALMAAHRAASGSKGAPTVYCQEEIERIQAYLHTVETEQAAGAASRAPADGCGFGRSRPPHGLGEALYMPVDSERDRALRRPCCLYSRRLCFRRSV